MRHHPPQFDRPWVLTPEGRASRLGMALDCVRCDDAEWPDAIAEYKRTPVFTEATVPRGLLRDHTTKRGTWGRIVVLDGMLDYAIEGRDAIQRLRPGADGVVVPEQPHRVAPVGAVRFYVAFHR